MTRPLQCTPVFYVSPHKAEKHLRHAADLLGNRRAALVREISKVYEEAPEGNAGGTGGFRRGGNSGRDRSCGGRGLPPEPDGDRWKEATLAMVSEGLFLPGGCQNRFEGVWFIENDVKSFLFAEKAED